MRVEAFFKKSKKSSLVWKTLNQSTMKRDRQTDRQRERERERERE